MRLHATDSWTTISTILLSDGSATGDMFYAGYFWNDHSPVAPNDYYSDGGGQYYLPGTSTYTPGNVDAAHGYPTGLGGNGFFQMYFWTGASEPSYAQAVADHQYVASVVCSVGPGMAATGTIAFPGDTLLDYMPAVILQQAVPEPSALALLVAGAGALLACAWRRRK